MFKVLEFRIIVTNGLDILTSLEYHDKIRRTNLSTHLITPLLKFRSLPPGHYQQENIIITMKISHRKIKIKGFSPSPLIMPAYKIPFFSDREIKRDKRINCVLEEFWILFQIYVSRIQPECYQRGGRHLWHTMCIQPKSHRHLNLSNPQVHIQSQYFSSSVKKIIMLSPIYANTSYLDFLGFSIIVQEYFINSRVILKVSKW